MTVNVFENDYAVVHHPPTAIASPPSVITFRLMPSHRITMIPLRMLKGMDMPATSVERKLNRKKKDNPDREHGAVHRLARDAAYRRFHVRGLIVDRRDLNVVAEAWLQLLQALVDIVGYVDEIGVRVLEDGDAKTFLAVGSGKCSPRRVHEADFGYVLEENRFRRAARRGR